MSQPPLASPAYTEAVNELAFQRVLLSSIDDTVENHEEARREVETEIKKLEQRIRHLKRGTKSTASNSQTLSASQSSLRTPAKSRSRMEEKPSNSPKVTSTASSASTPNSNLDLFPDTISPTMSLPSRKRTHSKHLDGGLAHMMESKSRRTSPSPYATNPTTPMTSSGDDDEFPSLDDEFFIKIARDEEEKRKREAADEAFARSLQNENVPSMSSAPSSTGPSALDRLHGMHRSRPGQSSSSSMLHGRSAPVNRKDPRSAQAFSSAKTKSEHPSMDMLDFDTYTSKPIARVKAEPFSSTAMPGSFSIDEFSNADDSDIEIIDAREFQDNGRLPRPSALSTNFSTPSHISRRSSFSQESANAGEAALRRLEQSSSGSALQMAMYGKQPLPAWMPQNSTMQGGTLPSMKYSGGVFDNSQPGLGSMNSMAMQQTGSAGMPGAYPGMNMQTPGPGLGYTVNNLPTYGMNPPLQYGGLHGPNTMSLGGVIGSSGTQDFDNMPDFLGPYPGPMNAAMQAQHDYITQDPRKSKEEIQELLKNIQPDVDLPPEDREGTPDGLKYPLYEHQKIALTWLKAMEESNNKGGILADDMGLGKTISSLALILNRPSSDPARKTTLIVGPVALVKQWELEISTKVKNTHSLSVHMVHGNTRKFAWDQLKLYDIVLTTYGTLGAELRRYNKYMAEQKANGNILDRDIDPVPLKKLFPLLGPASLFYRVILDEAQYIKNKATQAAVAACQVKSITRFCLTGTPMMNNVDELYSLIRFLRIKPYNEATKFKAAFSKLTKGTSTDHELQKAMRKLQAVLNAIMLRRSKTSLIDGKPIITLKPKTEEIQHVVFDEDEQNFYSALESKTRIQFNKYMRAGTVGKNYSNVLVLLLRLRQCCCHPHLITDFEEAPPAGADISEEGMVKLAKELTEEVIGRLMAANGVFECPVCYDAVTNPSIVVPCGHDTCSECLTKIGDRQRQDGEAGDGGSIKCPSCRGKVEMNKIIDYSTFKKVHMAQPDNPDDVETASEASDESTDADSDDSDTESDAGSDSDVDERGNLKSFIVPDDEFLDEGTESGGDAEDPIEDADDEAERPVKRKSKSKDKKKEQKRRRKVKKGKQKEKKEKSKGISIVQLKKEATRSIEGRRKYMKYLKKHWQPSAKVTKCMELLERFQEEGEKTIIFSQFVSLLDLVQVPIDQRKWSCERYDGSMNAVQRNDAIIRFTTKPDTKVMLISLKAGNAGLNLVAASRVIILDPFWNPYIEMQAVDRAYRIGQQKPVQVHRILIKNTVEDRIIELQERKKKLVDAALDEGAGRNISRLGQHELAFLFGFGGL